MSDYNSQIIGVRDVISALVFLTEQELDLVQATLTRLRTGAIAPSHRDLGNTMPIVQYAPPNMGPAQYVQPNMGAQLVSPMMGQPVPQYIPAPIGASALPMMPSKGYTWITGGRGRGRLVKNQPPKERSLQWKQAHNWVEKCNKHFSTALGGREINIRDIQAEKPEIQRIFLEKEKAIGYFNHVKKSEASGEVPLALDVYRRNRDQWSLADALLYHDDRVQAGKASSRGNSPTSKTASQSSDSGKDKVATTASPGPQSQIASAQGAQGIALTKTGIPQPQAALAKGNGGRASNQ